jgi:hypothetical protein
MTSIGTDAEHAQFSLHYQQYEDPMLQSHILKWGVQVYRKVYKDSSRKSFIKQMTRPILI